MWNKQTRGNKRSKASRIFAHTFITYAIAGICIGGQAHTQTELAKRLEERTRQRLKTDNVRKLAQYLGLAIVAFDDLQPQKAFKKYIDPLEIKPGATETFDSRQFAIATKRIAGIKNIQLVSYDRYSTEYLKFVYLAVSSKGPVAFEAYVFVYQGTPHLHDFHVSITSRSVEERIEGAKQLPSPMHIEGD